MCQSKEVIYVKCKLIKWVPNSSRDGDFEGSLGEGEITTHRAGREEETWPSEGSKV